MAATVAVTMQAEQERLCEVALKLVRSVDADLKRAAAIKVASHDDANEAGALRVRLKDVAKSIEEEFAGPCKIAFDAHRELTAARKRQLAPFEVAETCLNQQLAAWARKVEEERLREEQRLREEADRLAREAQIERAAELAAQGREEEADATMAETPIPLVVHATPPPKIEGASVKKEVKFQIMDPTLLPREYLMPDEQRIKKAVAAFGMDTKIPGVRVYEEMGIRSRRGA